MSMPWPMPANRGAHNTDAPRRRESNHCAIGESKEVRKSAKKHSDGFTKVQKVKKVRKAPSLTYFETDSDDSYGLLDDFSSDED